MVISESYREQQRQMHEMPRGYGGANTNAMGPMTLQTINEIGAQCVLDYGAGKGHLGEFLFRRGYKGDYRPYDPAVPYWADSPQPSEFVVCADVLEHIEPEYLESVLEDLKRVTLQRGLFSVCLRPAKKTLPDGRMFLRAQLSNKGGGFLDRFRRISLRPVPLARRGAYSHNQDQPLESEDS
jgi:hypothetical protein